MTVQAGSTMSPDERGWTEVDGVEVLGSLSPSRAGDFLRCPLLFRFRTIDRLPEPPSPDAARGSLVHKVLERLFDLPAGQRSLDRAAEMIIPAWQELVAAEPDLGRLFDDDADGAAAAAWLASARPVLARYFDLEDPQRLEPAERELYVETLLDSHLLLRGIIDRVDRAPDGALRLVDYKTGRSPGVGFEAAALFQMRFYALVLWRTRGVIPAMLQLVYLGNSEILRYEPDEDDLRATERKIEAIWRAIRLATETGDWQPRPSTLCAWCAHQALCPAYGGSPPPLPSPPDPLLDPGQGQGLDPGDGQNLDPGHGPPATAAAPAPEAHPRPGDTGRPGSANDTGSGATRQEGDSSAAPSGGHDA